MDNLTTEGAFFKRVITACYEMERFTSAFCNSDEPRYYPDHVY